MRFVNNKDFVAQFHRAVADGLSHLFDVRDTAMAGGVHFDDINTRPGGNRFARAALITRFGNRAVARIAVEGFGEQSGNRRLCRSACPGEKVAVCDTPRNNRILQGTHDMALPHDIGERLRTVFSIQRLIRHAWGKSGEVWSSL
jgi:hypothetical protein